MGTNSARPSDLDTFAARSRHLDAEVEAGRTRFIHAFNEFNRAANDVHDGVDDRSGPAAPRLVGFESTVALSSDYGIRLDWRTRFVEAVAQSFGGADRAVIGTASDDDIDASMRANRVSNESRSAPGSLDDFRSGPAHGQ
jgi:hypothetical protein